MQLFQIPLRIGETVYRIEPFTGSLIYSCSKKFKYNDKYPQKLKKALLQCDGPYQLIPNEADIYKSTQVAINKKNRFISKELIIFCKWNFALARRFASIGQCHHKDAKESIDVFRRISPGIAQNNFCLPRVLFAARMSQKFQECGVIFIGVFLPSKSMHAWIIEDCVQPDEKDLIWTHFKPVAALC